MKIEELQNIAYIKCKNCKQRTKHYRRGFKMYNERWSCVPCEEKQIKELIT